MLGLGKRANHTIGVAKMREFLHTGTLMRDTTILDHSGVVLSILRAPQRCLKFAPRSPQAIWMSAFCPMLGLGKCADHIVEVARMRGTFMTDTTILDHSGIVLSILRAPQLSLKLAQRPLQAI